MTPARHHLSRKQGASLVEVVVAMVVLATLAIAGAAFLAQARGDVSNQRNRRAAVEVAVSRLEAIRTSLYSDVAPPTKDYTIYYLVPNAGSWTHVTSDPGESTNINGRTLLLTTTVQYTDLESDNDSYDYINVSVAIGHRLNSPERIRLQIFDFSL